MGTGLSIYTGPRQPGPDAVCYMELRIHGMRHKLQARMSWQEPFYKFGEVCYHPTESVEEVFLQQKILGSINFEAPLD